MAIERVGQLTAETRVMTEIAYLGRGNLVLNSAAQAKTGTRSYHLGLGTSAFGLAFASLSALRVGYWHYMGQSEIDDSTMIYHAGSALDVDDIVSHIYIELDPQSGELILRRPNGSNSWEYLATVPLPTQYTTTGSWFHVGITHKIAASDGFVSVYVDGVQVFNYVGDTRPSRWNGTSVVFNDTTPHALGPGCISTSGAQGFTEAYVDDFFVDSIVGESDDPVPARRFLMVLPTAAGEDAEWTPIPAVANHLNVDDNPHDGDNTINKALAADLRDTFAMGDITLPVDHRIVAVLPSPFVKRLDSEIAHLLSVHAWDGLQYLDSDDIDLSMSYNSPVFARLTTQPDGSAWNETDFASMQFGYRSRGLFT